MPDELKTVETDTQQVIADTKATIAELETGEVKATGWVKTHLVWAIGLACFVLGAVAGAVIVAKL